MTIQNKPATELNGDLPLSPEEQVYHDRAVDSYAVERYLLNEMGEDEKLRFEQHYFECTACLKEVESGQTFVRSIRPPNRPFGFRALASFWKKWQATVLYPAAAALLGMVAFQNLYVIPGLQGQLAGVLPTTLVTAHQGERGGTSSDEKGQLVNTTYVTIDLDLPASASFPFYRVAVVDGLKPTKVLLSKVIPAPASVGSPLAFTVSKKVLGRGKYNAKVVGLSSEKSIDGTVLPSSYFDLE
jgi:hypothetical protein